MTGNFGHCENMIRETNVSFCKVPDGGNVHVGDYNGDKLWDIMCHYDDGRVKIKYNLGRKYHKYICTENVHFVKVNWLQDPLAHAHT